MTTTKPDSGAIADAMIAKSYGFIYKVDKHPIEPGSVAVWPNGPPPEISWPEPKEEVIPPSTPYDLELHDLLCEVSEPPYRSDGDEFERVQAWHFAKMADLEAKLAAAEAIAKVNLSMADCMVMVREELIEAGVIDKTVAPMFIANVVAQKLAQAEARTLKAVEAMREKCKGFAAYGVGNTCYGAFDIVKDINDLDAAAIIAGVQS